MGVSASQREVPTDWQHAWESRARLLQGQLPAGTPVVIFGDSWAEDHSASSEGVLAGVQGWPVQLARQLGLPVVGNFARGQSSTASLQDQLQTATAESALGHSAETWGRCLVVLHSGGNDFIGAEKKYNPFAPGNFWIQHCTWGFKSKAREVISNLKFFIQSLMDLGCQRILVSEPPFTSSVPALCIAQMVGINRRGRWVREQLELMLQELRASGAAGVEIARVPEVELLDFWVSRVGKRGCVGRLFRRDLFHPSQELHGYLAQAVACMLQRPADFAASIGSSGQTLLNRASCSKDSGDKPSLTAPPEPDVVQTLQSAEAHTQ
ncbi:unnamed protein product [Polarella glacialis]|uniref:SGNH hydrolase-type esterase domain-containing protein n=1 Tax=Polarella glacialis TaxID=89957 RepID=A0A813JTL9_POLGL|nr:unnamed protein product [Polarella glacialis]